MTHKQRLLAAARGETPDTLPYAPRFDLWFNANSYRGTLPERHRHRRSVEEIARAEGWAIHKVIPELLEAERPEENVYRGLGLYGLKENGYRVKFGPGVEIRVIKSRQGNEESTLVEYHTAKGMVSTNEVVNEEMRQAGVSITWMKEHAIKRVEDYDILAEVFRHVIIEPDYDRYDRWRSFIGEDGVATMMGTFSASPIQHIQRDFLDATEFFFHYNDHQKEMRRLAESMEGVYDQILRVVGDSPAEVVLWGANYDDMITYPPYFEKELSPWLRKASAYLAARGKLLVCHTDGENQGLIDVIAESGMHIAEAVCCAPMTKVPLETYYDRWCRSGKLTILGGIPQSLLSPATATEEEFQGYLDHFFRAVAPGARIIVGVADTTPPNADFDRLCRLGERVRKEGSLPLKAGGFNPVAAARPEQAVRKMESADPGEAFRVIQAAVLKGDHAGIKARVGEMIAAGHDARQILNQGMISAMEIIGGKFKSGDVFIPEVLLSARAMNEALTVLEPYLAGDKTSQPAKVLIGTVRGDMHDIGKNMVATMLRGVGMEIKDLGVNVATDVFVKQVEEYRPDVLGISALLTTTMPEMKKIIEALGGRGLRGAIKIVVGGAPVNAKFAADIGADGYAKDAGEAVNLVKRLLARS